jgi:hypothetical protein
MKKWNHTSDPPDGLITKEEFFSMTRKDPEVVRVLYEMGLITKGVE